MIDDLIFGARDELVSNECWVSLCEGRVNRIPRKSAKEGVIHSIHPREWNHQIVLPPQRPGSRFAHPIRLGNPFSVLRIPACGCLRMIPTGYNFPEVVPFVKSLKANPYPSSLIDGYSRGRFFK